MRGTRVLVALAVACGGCGWSVREAAPREPTVVSVGDEHTLGTTAPPPRPAPVTPAEPVVVPDGPASPGEPAPAAAAAAGPARGHRTVVDVEGFRISLTVGDGAGLDFFRGNRIRLTMRVENRTTEVRDYDTNEQRIFEFIDVATGEVAWDSARCKKGQTEPDPLRTGMLQLQPGRSASYDDAYPQHTSDTDPLPRPDCRVAAGTYDVVALFPWCPPGSAPMGTCYPDGVQRLRSLPVRVTLLHEP